MTLGRTLGRISTVISTSPIFLFVPSFAMNETQPEFSGSRPMPNKRGERREKKRREEKGERRKEKGERGEERGAPMLDYRWGVCYFLEYQ